MTGQQVRARSGSDCKLRFRRKTPCFQEDVKVADLSASTSICCFCDRLSGVHQGGARRVTSPDSASKVKIDHEGDRERNEEVCRFTQVP